MMKAVKLLLLVGLAGSLMLATEFWGKAEPQDQNLQKQVKELRKQVASLETQVESLQKRLEQLERKKEVITLPPSVLPKTQKVPLGWSEKWINGMKYYVVPVQEGDSKPAR